MQLSDTLFSHIHTITYRKPKVYFKSIESERMVDEEDLKWFAKLSFEDTPSL